MVLPLPAVPEALWDREAALFQTFSFNHQKKEKKRKINCFRVLSSLQLPTLVSCLWLKGLAEIKIVFRVILKFGLKEEMLNTGTNTMSDER